MAQIRYNSKPSLAKIEINADDEINIEFENPQLAITPGQSIVFYENNTLIGGYY